MGNLFDETKEILKKHEKTILDIIWVGSKDGMWNLPLYDLYAVFNVEYNSGYGGQEIATDLVVVGKDWWLERHEYDGSEWWGYKEMPSVSNTTQKIIKTVKGGCWIELGDMN